MADLVRESETNIAMLKIAGPQTEKMQTEKANVCISCVLDRSEAFRHSNER